MTVKLYSQISKGSTYGARAFERKKKYAGNMLHFIQKYDGRVDI